MSRGFNLIICIVILFMLQSIFPCEAYTQEESSQAKRKKQPLSEYSKQWLEEVVPYIITDAEREVFTSLPTEADRGKFIESFWKSRDPDPQTPENEFKIDYYKRIAHANKYFGYSGIKGWRTDRGKIYILLGPPSEIQRDMSPTETSFAAFHGPKEIWNYWGIPNPKLPYNMEFIFVDKFGSGNYVMESSLRLTDMGSSSFDINSMHYFFDEMEYLSEAMKSPFENMDELRGIITTQVTYDRIPIQFDLFFLKGNAQKTYIPLTLEVPYSALTHKEAGNEWHFSVRAMVDASDKLGRLVFERSKDFEFKRNPADPNDRENNTLQLQTSLSLEPDSYNIHLLVLDNISGAVGTLHQRFIVPDFNTSDLILSDIFLWSEEWAKKKKNHPPKEKVSADSKRIFSTDEEIMVFFEVYNLMLDNKTGLNKFTSQYLIYDGEKLLARVPVPQGEPTADTDCRVQSSLRLKNLRPGHYTLRVTVVDSLAGKERFKNISFSVIQ